ncbi:MAG: SDR family oxidoreductase [Tannerella sp.]|jgi:NAD(P)-dependent dehydrogenase (short-subunit alcohol dehydrogenase family)|nr:SDR family oxidoreductase [Tannerella sp.]
MKTVCVITGGDSGMGLATAKILGKEHHIIVGRSVKKLETTLQELRSESIEAEVFPCDISDSQSVNKLAEHAKSIGKIVSVIHAAGMSPNMGEARQIMEANALGTININNAFYDKMGRGSCVVDVSSISGYLAPKFIMPTGSYKYSRTNIDKFFKKMMQRVNLFPKKLRPFLAYCISKNFVIWFAKTDAARFGQKGARVVSVTPGTFETPMGELEKENADNYLKYCAIKHTGKVEEIADLLAFCASEKAGYLTGVDIICDGGCLAGKKKI